MIQDAILGLMCMYQFRRGCLLEVSLNVELSPLSGVWKSVKNHGDTVCSMAFLFEVCTCVDVELPA
jgi:hypothetical protein